MNNTEKIYASVEVDLSEMMNIPQKEFASEIKSRLSNALVEFMIENMDHLPIKLIETIEVMVERHKYIITANLISEDELDRLRKIEELYNQLFNTSIPR